jgi:hypothetical protein
MLEPRTDERSKDAEPPKGDPFFFFVCHDQQPTGGLRPFLGGFFRRTPRVPDGAETAAGYRRRTFGCKR